MSFGFLISGLCDSQVRTRVDLLVNFPRNIQLIAGGCYATLNWVLLSQPITERHPLAVGRDAFGFAVHFQVPSKHTCMPGEKRQLIIAKSIYDLNTIRPCGTSCSGVGVSKDQRLYYSFWNSERMLLVEILFLINPFYGILQVYFGLISTSIWIGIFLCLSWIVVKIKSWWPLNDVLSFVLTLKLSYSQCSCMYIAFFHQTVSDT